MYGISYYNDKDSFAIYIKFHVSLTYYTLKFSYVWLYDNIRDDYDLHMNKLFSFYKRRVFIEILATIKTVVIVNYLLDLYVDKTDYEKL
jgi:hypothetical protein